MDWARVANGIDDQNNDSLSAKFNELICNIVDLKLNIILLTETWLKPTDPDSLVNIRGYSIHRADRLNRVGGGVCIYLCDEIITEFAVQQYIAAIQGVEALHVSLTKETVNINIVCIYRPNDVSHEANVQLIDYLSQLSTLDNLIITGDFNYPNITWPIDNIPDTNSATSKFMHFVADSNPFQLITEPTRFRINNEPSVLDLIFTNDENIVTYYEILPPVGLSDHAVIYATTQLNIHMPNKYGTEVFKIIDFDQLFGELSAIDWISLLSTCDDVDILWEKFYSTITVLVDKNSRSKVWINTDIMDKYGNNVTHTSQKRLWKRYKRSKAPEDYQTHRNFCKYLVSTLRSSRREFDESL
ncbi:hypothetical protein JTB14_014097 [Gonioctena quinquepunctata]|nr:hypothetical protein JTB14_014097 [Gonioctena quinquepunctata]